MMENEGKYDQLLVYLQLINKKNMNMKMLKQSWLLVVILTSNLFFASCNREDNPVNEQQESETIFQAQLDEALAWAKAYGPSTQAVAEAVALRHNGKATPINYKTRQSAERKCRTDNSKPFELKDLARTTVLCEYDSLLIVIDDVKTTATEQNFFGRYPLSSTTSNLQPLGTTPSAVTSTRPATTATGETSSIWNSTIFKQRYR